VHGEAGPAKDKKMSNEELFRELATRACCEALQEVLQEKSRELAEGVAHRMGTALTTEPADFPKKPRSARSRLLRDGALLISNSRTQTETLESLLAAGSSITSACGLMILRGAQASGWSSVGLASPENFKGATIDTSRGAAAAVLSSCAARVAKASEFDQAFTAQLGLDSSVEVLLVPVMLKERVAALLLALSGDSEDLAALEVLVQVAQLSLELQGYRKVATQVQVPPSVQSSAQPAAPASAATSSAAAAPVETPPRTEPPRAPASQVALSPRAPASQVASPEVTSEAESARMDAAQPRPEPPSAYSPASAVGSASGIQAAESSSVSGLNQPSPVLDEAHERGRRFAKLLVEEIKLYNQAKVSEGRAQRDLYSRLREDIEKSRAAYQKRYGETVKDVDYFSQELMRILADNDRSLMGAGFPG